MSNTKIYEIVTDRILAALARGTVPWHQTWSGVARSGMMPQNVTTRKPYRGINVWLTLSAAFESPFWLTFRQAQELGGTVRKGEHGTPIVYAEKMVKARQNDETGAEEFDRFWFLKYFTVFNAVQCDGLPYSPAELFPQRDSAQPTFQPIESAQRIIDGMPNRPQIAYAQQSAFYQPANDSINLPRPETFESREAFYRTAFHELSHSTAHDSRVGRKLDVRFRSHDYGREELVAEMSSAFLSATAGIDSATFEISAGYIDGWIKTIREDSRLVVWAASQAQRAAKFILGVSAADDRAAA